MKKSHGSGLNFPAQYEEDRNDLLERIITSDVSWIRFYKSKKNHRAWFAGKEEEDVKKKFKNEQSIRQAMLTAF